MPSHSLFGAVLNRAKTIVAKGSAFLSNGHLTNNHVFAGPPDTNVWVRRDGESTSKNGYVRHYSEFAKTLVTGSDKNSYDYAVLRIPELIEANDYQFSLASPLQRRIGETIAILGYPLEHQNLTCHCGIISSFYQSGLASMVQLDASVNSGNSGGPLIHSDSGQVLGIVTRKATGLSRTIGAVRDALAKNLEVVRRSIGMVTMGAFDPVEGFVASQHQINSLLDEIERQANVGIGYAVSADHLLAEPCLSA